MYQRNLERTGTVGPGLGDISIPSWITNIVGAIVKGKQVQVPTPSGTVVVNLDNPTQIAALAKMLSGTKIVNAPPGGVPILPGGSFVDRIPGGWVTVAAGGGLLLYLMLRRR